MIKNLILIACGGAIGACGRYLITLLCTNLFGKSFPYGTLSVNVLGSFIMGACFILLQQASIPENPWRPIITVGLLGALTTFSTFSMDNLLLIQTEQWLKLGINISLNIILCLIAVASGYNLFAK